MNNKNNQCDDCWLLTKTGFNDVLCFVHECEVLRNRVVELEKQRDELQEAYLAEHQAAVDMFGKVEDLRSQLHEITKERDYFKVQEETALAWHSAALSREKELQNKLFISKLECSKLRESLSEI